MKELTLTPTFSVGGEVVTIVITASDMRPITYPELASTLAVYAQSIGEPVEMADLDS